MTEEKSVVAETIDTQAQPPVGIGKTHEIIPPLKDGDRLTREEFERRYNAMPHLKKAELIEGVVYMPPAAVRIDIHGTPHSCINTWLGHYWVATPGVNLGDNSTVRLSDNTEPQPDALLRIDESKGGHSRVDEDGYVEGPPELVVEIAGTSASYDSHQKLDSYRRNGVIEYIVWRTQDKQLDWFQLVDGNYVSLEPNAQSIIESRVFPGLRLDIGALLKGDLAAVMSELRQGLETAEHTAFVNRLAKR